MWSPHNNKNNKGFNENFNMEVSAEPNEAECHQPKTFGERIAESVTI